MRTEHRWVNELFEQWVGKIDDRTLLRRWIHVIEVRLLQLTPPGHEHQWVNVTRMNDTRDRYECICGLRAEGMPR